MNVSRLFSLSTTVAGTIAAARVLRRRHSWEESNKRVAICADFDDAQAAAIRAGLPFNEMAAQIKLSGATHLSLPELTLGSLVASGRLASRAPDSLVAEPPRVGHWNYLAGPPALARYLAAELAERLPYTEARVLSETTLVFAGALSTIGEIGLGFDEGVAASISASGLKIVPRPVNYAWPEKCLLQRTLAQAARLGDIVAFAGNMILGHEMHLDETLAALEEEELIFGYFAQSRHQKGDWFIAKRRAPNVVLAHAFTPAEMTPLDYHAAAHNWTMLVRERGIRLCYINFFRELHAAEPLEGLSYLRTLKQTLENAGYVVTDEVGPPVAAAAPTTTELALSSLTSAGIASAALVDLLNLRQPLAISLTATAAAAAAALPYFERSLMDRRQPVRHDGHDHHHGHHDPGHNQAHSHENHHHHDHAHEDDHEHAHPDLTTDYPPSYAPKLLALAASMAPVAALQANRRADGVLAGWLSGLVFEIGGAAGLAAFTGGSEYQLRIEEYRGFNLDWLMPLAAAALTMPRRGPRLATLAALAAGWLAAGQGRLDLLATFDPDHAAGHTHHISAANRLVGDVFKAVGPRPARKWVGLGALGNGLSRMLADDEQKDWAALAAAAGALGNAFGLVSFRRPERALAITLPEASVSLAAGSVLTLLLLLLRHDS